MTDAIDSVRRDEREALGDGTAVESPATADTPVGALWLRDHLAAELSRDEVPELLGVPFN